MSVFASFVHHPWLLGWLLRAVDILITTPDQAREQNCCWKTRSLHTLTTSASWTIRRGGCQRPGSIGGRQLLMFSQKVSFTLQSCHMSNHKCFLISDTDSFIIGMNVYVDGVKPGRIQFIGETKFGPGEWAGVFLDEPIGKNDGSVMSTRYFTCEPRHGVFSRLYRLTREPIDGAEEILNQVKR